MLSSTDLCFIPNQTERTAKKKGVAQNLHETEAADSKEKMSQIQRCADCQLPTQACVGTTAFSLEKLWKQSSNTAERDVKGSVYHTHRSFQTILPSSLE